MQSLIRSKSAGVTGGRGTAGAGPGTDLHYVNLLSVLLLDLCARSGKVSEPLFAVTCGICALVVKSKDS